MCVHFEDIIINQSVLCWYDKKRNDYLTIESICYWTTNTHNNVTVATETE